MTDVNITVDGKKLTSPAGTLLIDACKAAGIEVPSFCYYPGLSLQAACRMCVVRIEKMPKLQTACTVPVAEGMVVTTESDEVSQARKATIELLLGNHPLDCPVCDAGGECELQDMTFKYGAAESKFMEIKQHKDEQQWSPVVYFDRPRCILCYRCVRVCGEGMDVWALGIQNRGANSVIAPNKEDHLECEECGMCIDICPVGALTSGAYRYKTRPWEMNHVGTICTHCGDGCKTTLGVRRSSEGTEIVRGDNRDKSGINGDFLCIKGRYAFDFANHEDRLQQPLIRKDGRLVPASWEEALETAGGRLRDTIQTHRGENVGVIGSNRTTNEENYLVQKFARVVLGSNNIDHQRTADFPAFAAALAGQPDKAANMREVAKASAVLLIGNDPTEKHPLLAWQIRTNVRLNHGKLYIINSQKIKLSRQATGFAQANEAEAVQALAGTGGDPAIASLREKLRQEKDVVIIFGSELRGEAIAALMKFGSSLPAAKYICLGDYANSRGAADMGLYPDLLPGYLPLSNRKFSEEWGLEVPTAPGMNTAQMLEAAQDGALKALLIVGANPVSRFSSFAFRGQRPFMVVQDMFLTETATLADVVLPAACAYEKSGTFTNTCGDLQLLQKAGDFAGVKPDFEIIVRIADRMGFDIRKLVPFGAKGTRADTGQSRGAQSGEADRHAVWLRRQGLETKTSPFDPMALLDEIQRLVPAYEISRLNLMAGNDVATNVAASGRGTQRGNGELIWPSNDQLFSSGTLGRYSNALNSVIENRKKFPEARHSEVMAD